MEQTPVGGQPPLDPPSADVARLYLEEAQVVERRTEERVDRRRVARLYLIDGAALSVLCTVLLLSVGARSSMTMLLIAPFLLWLQLEGQLRRAYGFRESGGRLDRSWRFMFLGIWLVTMVIGFWFGTTEIPRALLFLPALLSVAGFGWLSLRERRKAQRVPLPPRAVPPMRRGDRLATAAIGIALGVFVSVAVASIEVTGIVLGVFLLGILVWAQIAERRGGIPQLGELWRWPQWTAFSLGCAVLTASVLLAARTDLVTPAISIAAGGVVAVLIAAIALLGGRRV